jgi:hypothetical protein
LLESLLLLQQIFMSKQVYIALIVVLGFLLMPILSHACSKKTTPSQQKTEQSSASNEESADDDKKDCCKKAGSQKGKTDKDCCGKCDDGSCSCSVLNLAFSFPFVTTLISNNLSYSIQKQKYAHIEIYLSSGFYSIWIPPNIV